MQAMVCMTGEPMKTGVDPLALGSELAHAGFHLRENLSPVEIEARYFKGRGAAYHAFEHVHFALAEVGSAARFSTG